MGVKETKFWFFISRMLPKKIAYFSFINVMAHCTTGKYSSTSVPKLTGMDAIKRYSNDNNL